MEGALHHRTLSDLDFGRVLDRLAHHARTTLGEARARDPHLFAEAGRVERELDATTQMRALLDEGKPPPFAGIGDVRPILGRAARESVLEAEELLQVADAARAMWLLERFLQARVEDAPILSELGAQLPDLDGVHADLFDNFDDQGRLTDGASDELGKLRARRRSLHERIRSRIRAMLHENGVEEHLMDTFYTVREDRYVLPVRSGQRAEVDGIIHGGSQTGATLFIEPAELVAVNNELKLCEQAVAVEEHRILAALTAIVAEKADGIAQGLAVVAELDLVFARARLAVEMDANPPLLSDRLQLDGARNPLLLLRGIPVIPIDVQLGADLRFLVITGPNAGGKTVALSTLGLCALMARSGMHLPVGPDSTIPVFGDVLTVMGDNQDMQADLSTFSGHVQALVHVLATAGDGSLVLLDELAAGTAPGQGAALAIAVLEALADRGAVGAVTTHYERLKTLSLEDHRFHNAAVSLHPKTQEPEYRLHIGTPGTSSGLETALKLGVSPDVVTRARQILGDPAQNVERVLKRLEAEREALATERSELALARESADLERQGLQRDRERMDAEGEALIRRTREAALKELGEARDEIRRVVRALQADPDARAVNRRRVKLAEVETRLGTGAAPTPAGRPPQAVPLAAAEAVVGAAVFVPAFGRDGVITQVRGKKVEVSVGKIRTRVALTELQRAKTKDPEPRKKPRPSSDIRETTPPPRAGDNTCDVRGKRLDEAVAEVERFLDNALLANRSAVFVLHGHGTGRLRDGLRDHLRSSRYVDRLERAAEDKGGDAVTLVWLQ